MMGMFGFRRLGYLIVLLLSVSACAGRNDRVLPAATVASAPAPVAVASATSVAEDPQWQTVYTRPDWSGGPVVDLRATGDIMLGRLVAELAERRGYQYPFAGVSPLLAGDLTFGNLEGPLTDRRDSLRPGPYRLPAPPAFGAALREAGFDLLSLANNHALDAGPAGLHDTVTTLTGQGISVLGAGAGAEAARQPATLEVNGLRLALLGFNAVPDPDDQPDEGQGWGRAWLDEQALAAVRQARGAYDAVIVAVHWGREYQPQPAAEQRTWARRLVGAGADLIIGAHPHVLQPIEAIEADGRSGVVAYSLGNFIFDQTARFETRSSVVLRVLLDRQGVARIAAAPIAMTAGQQHPLPIQSTEGQLALSNIAAVLRPTQAEVWNWDGHAAHPIAAVEGVALAERAWRVPADLRGDGKPLWVTRDQHGIVEVRDGATDDALLVWHNESPDWYVSSLAVGDPNNDGRVEVLLVVWKPDATGRRVAHPFLLGWRGGRYRVIWGGSALEKPIQDAALGDLDGDGAQELVVLEGGQDPGEPGDTISVWRWSGWLFQLAWRSPPGRWTGVRLRDVAADSRPEIIALTDERENVPR